MKLLLLYATSQGQTGRIMQHTAERLERAGHAVTLLQAGIDRMPDIADFDACILAASMHAGQYQAALRHAVQAQAGTLSARPGLFLSVSLTAAGHDAQEHAELAQRVQAFLDETGWQGPQVAHVAGALRFSEYGFFEYWAMRWIARRRQQQDPAFADLDVSGREDIEFTDWAALDMRVDAWMADAERDRPDRR